MFNCSILSGMDKVRHAPSYYVTQDLIDAQLLKAGAWESKLIALAETV